MVRVWKMVANGDIVPEESFDKAFATAPHSGWVRDVAWAPYCGSEQQIIASCGEDKMVHLWCSHAGGATWVVKKLPVLDHVAWRVSW